MPAPPDTATDPLAALPPGAKAVPKRDPVADAFGALIDTLAEDALSASDRFDRATSFRKHVLDLAARWREGRPAHGTGAKKAAAP